MNAVVFRVLRRVAHARPPLTFDVARRVGCACSTFRFVDVVPPLALAAVDLACEQDGKFCWVVTGIPYSPSDLLAHVISRGIAAYGASASVVSVHADNVYLPEDRWHGEIGHRRVTMVLKDGTSYLQLVADNGKLTAEVKALSTKIEDLKVEIKDQKVEIEDLKVEIKDQKVEIKDQKVEIKDLIEKDVVKATKIENLEAANKDLIEKDVVKATKIENLEAANKDQKVEIKDLTDERDHRRLSSRMKTTLTILKDLIDASGARQVEGKFSSFNSLVVHRNNNAHFLRMGPKPLRDPTALLEYTQKREDHDSRAVLCAKLKMVRDFVQQGLPEVRMSG